MYSIAQMSLSNETFLSVFYIVFGLMFILSVRNLFNVRRNVNYFLGNIKNSSSKNKTNFFIVIPLMHESETVDELASDLLSLNYPADQYWIIFVTTIRERDKNNENKTFEAAKRIAKKHSKIKDSANLIVLECTKTSGFVATQINFAIESIKKNIKPDDFILIYNADSAPGKDTLLAADNLIEHYGKRANVMQQSSLFTRNIEVMLRRKSYGAAANAIHQSLWTLKHEVTMTRRQSLLSRRQLGGANWLIRMLTARFTVCVGHGIFVRKRYYDKHPLNEDATIEDTQYGLYQSLQRTPVFPVPILENSESPSTFLRVTAQKRGWFKMIFDLTKLLITTGKRVFRSKKARAEFVSIVLQVATIYAIWFMHSIFMVGTFLAAVGLRRIELVIAWVVFYAIYWLVPALYLASVHGKLVPSGRLKSVDAIRAWTYGAPAILTHSLGPWLAIYDRLRGSNHRKKTLR